MTWLLAFKLFTVPVLVAAVSLIARRFGAVVGGLILGLPWMTGPVLFFLTFDKGLAWFEKASIGATAAPIAICGYLLSYGWFAYRVAPPFALLAAIISFAICTMLMSYVAWTATTAAVGACVALMATRFLLPRPRAAEAPQPLPWWDIPLRMVSAGLMVLLLNVVAEIAGPSLSGIIASYPVILTSVVTFVHALSGPDAVARMLGGISLSLQAFIVFFSVTTWLSVSHGIAVAYAAAIVAGLISSALLMALGRWLDRLTGARQE